MILAGSKTLLLPARPYTTDVGGLAHCGLGFG